MNKVQDPDWENHVSDQDYPDYPLAYFEDTHQDNVHDFKFCGWSHSTLCYDCNEILGGQVCDLCLDCVSDHPHWFMRDDLCHGCEIKRYRHWELYPDPRVGKFVKKMYRKYGGLFYE